MTKDQRNKKAEQLRLAAHIIETGCEWEVKCGDSHEWLGNESPFVAAYKGDAGAAVAHGYEIRIKEPAVPEGWRELSDDEKDGRWIEGAKWLSPVEMWKHHEATKRGVGCYGLRTSRVIIPVAKPKKRVPLGAGDITPGTCIKPSNEYIGWGMVCEVDSSGIHLFASRHLSWNELMNNNWSIKRPTDTEWQPAWKEVES